MKIECSSLHELSASDVAAWQCLARGAPIETPFLGPEFARVIARHRPVRVVVARQAERPVAFFAFERRGRRGYPLALKLSDFQGVVEEPGFDLDAREILSAARVSTLSFDHLLPTRSLEPWALTAS